MIKIHVIGIPPHKDSARSIRNPKHPHHDRFLALRTAAKEAMGARECYKGSVFIRMHYTRKQGNKNLSGYLSGICDTLGGSHGFTFHWYPIVFLDDCQVMGIDGAIEDGELDEYSVEIEFLEESVSD